MPLLADLTTQLAQGRDLSSADVERAAAALADTKETDDAKAALLSALANKGETAAEVAAFATAFRARAVNPGVEAWAPRANRHRRHGGRSRGRFQYLEPGGAHAGECGCHRNETRQSRHHVEVRQRGPAGGVGRQS